MKKKLIALMTCLLLVMAMPLSALAVQKANLIQSVWIEEAALTMICAGPQHQEEPEETAETDETVPTEAPVEPEYTLSIDGTEIAVTKSDVRTKQIPVTVFCLVDTSGSMSEYKMRLIQETLQTISSSLGEKDNMVIASLDNELVVGPVLDTQEARDEAIAGIQTTAKDTNLYAGIVQSMEKLTSDTGYHDYGCVVVLSDGTDCQDNGMTEQEVINAVQEARLPLYTVALVQDYNERDGGKILGSFARASYGGLHQTTVSEGGNKPIRWDLSGEEFGSMIWNALQDMAVLDADLTGLEIDDRKTEVRVDISMVCGSDSYADTKMMNVADFANIPPVVEEEPEESSTPWVLIGVGAGVLVLILVIVIVVVKKKKKAEPEASEVPETPDGFDAPESSGVPAEPVVSGQAPEARMLQQKYRVYLTDIPYGTQKLVFTVNAVEVITFGRNQNRVKCLVSSADTQLSGVHFAMTLQKDHYCIRDEGSKNGTFHNGVPISGKGWVKLQSGDRIRAGAYEYRVVIEPVE